MTDRDYADALIRSADRDKSDAYEKAGDAFNMAIAVADHIYRETVKEALITSEQSDFTRALLDVQEKESSLANAYSDLVSARVKLDSATRPTP